jgi:hypothetical protein
MSEKNLLLEYLKGRTLEEAKEICKDSKFILRVVREDGKSKIVTRDWKLNRLNLELENNIVKEVYIG